MFENGQEILPIWAKAAVSATGYRERLNDQPQRPIHTYRESLQVFEEATPKTGTDGHDVIEELVRKSEPGLHAMTGSRFFGWVIGNSHEVGVAADWLTAAWGQNAGNHSATPAAAAAETIAARWLLDILGLPADASVGFVTGCTMANFVGLAAARGEVLHRLGWDVEGDGLFGAPPIKVILGEDAHSTVFSALQYLGLGQNRVVKVPTDGQGAMIPEAFAQAIKDAQSDSAVIAIAQAGQINTGAFDPLIKIVEAAKTHSNCWLHVDGAFGLWARASHERAELAVGIEGADSWATDGHKWLQTPYDCGYTIVRNGDAHRRAMTIAASYLPSNTEGERDPSHYVPELSRRARGFATWAMIKHLGQDGIAEMVTRHCRLARLIADILAGEDGITVMNQVVLNQIAVHFGPMSEEGDGLTKQTIEAVQKVGTCFAGGALWKGRWIMRLSVISFSMTDEDARQSAQAIIQAWRRVRMA